MTASNESPTVRGPYVPRQHQKDPTIPVASTQPNTEFQQFLMWKQQQEFHQWQQQQQQFAEPPPTYPNQQQSQWSSSGTSPNFSPNGHQYQQFLQYQQHSQQQQPGNHNKQPSNYNGSSAATSNGYSSTPQTSVLMNNSNGQVQSEQSVAPSSNAVNSNTATPSISPNTGTATNCGNTSCNAVSNTDTNNNANSTSSSGSGCFNPVTSLINLMGVATNTTNNVTATNKKTTTSLESMKKAFSGMVSTFQDLGGQIPGIGGCVNL